MYKLVRYLFCHHCKASRHVDDNGKCMWCGRKIAEEAAPPKEDQ